MSGKRRGRTVGPRTRDRLAGLASYGIHHTRESLPSVRVWSSPSLTRSMSREWIQRRDKGTSSASEWALTAGASLSRIAFNSSSSLTWRGRPPAPICRNHPARVISRTNEREQHIEVTTSTGWSRESRPPRAVLTPARRSARGWLSETHGKAMKVDVPPGIESTGSTDFEQTNLTNFGFVPASQLRIDDLDTDQEGQR